MKQKDHCRTEPIPTGKESEKKIPPEDHGNSHKNKALLRYDQHQIEKGQLLLVSFYEKI